MSGRERRGCGWRGLGRASGAALGASLGSGMKEQGSGWPRVRREGRCWAWGRGGGRPLGCWETAGAGVWVLVPDGVCAGEARPALRLPLCAPL